MYFFCHQVQIQYLIKSCTLYIPEDDSGSVSLCVNISVNIILFEPFTFIIETAQKFPAEAEGKSIGYISSIYNHIIILNQILTLYTSGVNITIQPPGLVTCIDFSDIVVNDDAALEGNETFTIFIEDTPLTAMVTILDNDGEPYLYSSYAAILFLLDAYSCSTHYNVTGSNSV